MMTLILLLSGCSLVDKNVAKRLNETKIRNEISSHKSELVACARPNESVSLEISVGINKQISYFRVISKKSDKELTDCLFKVLDLLYFKNIKISDSVNFKYLLTVK